MSSPTAEPDARPASRSACTSSPRLRHWIQPRCTGRFGIAEHEAAHDVGAPGDRLKRHGRPRARRPSRTATRAGSSRSRARRAGRRAASRGAGRSRCPRTAGGRAGSSRTRVTSSEDTTIARASPDRSGARRRARFPQPEASAESCQFHIIHAAVVWKKSLSPGRRSTCSRCSFRCSSSVPPAPWTMPLGAPVVPDEKRVNSGWSNGKPRPLLAAVLPSLGLRRFGEPLNGATPAAARVPRRGRSTA